MTSIRRMPFSCLCTIFALAGPLMAAEQPASASPALKLVVFNFELEDLSAASVILGQITTNSASLEKVSQMARKEMAKSSRYLIIDPSRTTSSSTDNNAHKDCDGCEVKEAAALGADQALIGIVRRVSQTDYYVSVQVTDVHSGKVLAQEAANFAGGEDGWASGVRMLIDHQVLPVIAAQSTVTATCRIADVNPVSGNAECVDPRGAPVDPPPPRDNRS